MVKSLPANAGDAGDSGLIPWLGRSLQKAWPPTPVFLPGKSHGQRSPAGYSPWGHKELGMTVHSHTSLPLKREVEKKKIHLSSPVLSHFSRVRSYVRLQSCDPMGHSLPGSSVHGILQARILEWEILFLADFRE